MIGAKTLTAVLLSAVVAAVIGVLLSPARVAALGSDTLFWIALWAAVAGPLTVRFVGAHRPSAHGLFYSGSEEAWEGGADIFHIGRHRLALGETEGDAVDLPPAAQYAVYFSLAFVVGLATMDSRAIAIVREAPDRVLALGSPACSDPTLKTAAQRAQLSPGCALVRRAHELGYVDDLGSCAVEETVVEQECAGRHHDEPFLHYGWRLLRDFWDDAKQLDVGAELSSLATSVAERTERPDRMVAHSRLMGGGPRAAHHIWTNLPHPEGGLRETTGDAFSPSRCVGEFQRLPHRPALRGGRNPSAVFQHVLGKLLFESRYAPPAASCREVSVHWGSSTDVCSRLDGLTNELDDARAVLRRLRDARGAAREVDPRWQPERYLSFSCFVVEARDRPARALRPLRLEDQTLFATELRVPEPFDVERAHVEWYGLIGSLLARGFHYGALMSEAGVDPESEAGFGEELFRYPWFRLARLDYLDDLDIFLGHDWIVDRDDLLEVYPYHVHLRNFVETFRRQYVSERGRL